MNIGSKDLEFKFERAVALLVRYMPVAKHESKPIIMHAI